MLRYLGAGRPSRAHIAAALRGLSARLHEGAPRSNEAEIDQAVSTVLSRIYQLMTSFNHTMNASTSCSQAIDIAFENVKIRPGIRKTVIKQVYRTLKSELALEKAMSPREWAENYTDHDASEEELAEVIKHIDSYRDLSKM